ncbi:NDR1/HIN1-like protein 13 [Herrania umbratica]|uniref:NDR1/HIN1-like protein 13 n=1 Tax=Herrania umbratica TaxID=108875 RepID=A0A6J1AHI9_9ROSI|nr:NDR1/HIN1-like protein 13 [Herrania umbratica]
MAMASPNESPKRGYPCPGDNLADPDRLRSPRFAFNVPPSSPSFHYQDRPLTPPPMFRNAVLREHRRRHFQNNNYTANSTTTTTSSHAKVQICLIGAVMFFSILTVIGIPIMLFYVFGPHSPSFSVEQVSFYYPIFYSSPTRFSSLFNITMKVNNPARHIGVFFERDNSIVASYYGIRLCSGEIPPFFQPPKDEMLVQSPLTGLGVVLPDDVNQKLENDHKKERVPLTLSMMGMVRFKMGSVTSRALLKVSCEMVLDNLMTYTPNIISSSCDSAAGFWFPTIRN